MSKESRGRGKSIVYEGKNPDAEVSTYIDEDGELVRRTGKMAYAERKAKEILEKHPELIQVSPVYSDPLKKDKKSC